MPYFLILEQSTALPITIDKFVDALTASWKNVKFEDATPGRFFELSWSLDTDEGLQLGYLHKNTTVIAIDDFEPGIARFAAWFRHLIPAEEKITLSHDSWGVEGLEIKMGDTEEAILDKLNKM